MADGHTDGSSGSSEIKKWPKPLDLHHCSKKPPPPPKGDIIKLKKCVIPPNPDPIPPTPCEIQIREQKLKRGVVFCPKPPPVPPPPVAPCLAICIEKVKNMPVNIRQRDQPTKCPVARVETGFARCNRIRDAKAAHPDLPWPGCPPEPPPPPPIIPTPCEIVIKERRVARCKEKYKHMYPPEKH